MGWLILRLRRNRKSGTPKKAGASRPRENVAPTVEDLLSRAKRASIKLERNPEKEVASVARVSPHAAIPLAWGHVEAELRNAIVRLKLGPDSNGQESSLDHIRVLSDAKVLSGNASSLLHGMRQLRNTVAHNSIPRNAVSSKEATEYGRLAVSVTRLLRAVKKRR